MLVAVALILAALAMRTGVQGRGELSCFKPTGGFNCSKDPHDPRNIVCPLPEDRILFNSFPQKSSGCLVIRLERKSDDISMVCSAFRNPPITVTDSHFHTDCICLGKKLCFAQSYWEREAIGRWIDSMPQPTPSSVATQPSTDSTAVSTGSSSSILSPSPTPPTPRKQDLSCLKCQGRATCIQLQNLNVTCFIPNSDSCEKVRVDSDKFDCSFQTEIYRNNVSFDAVTFKAGVAKRTANTVRHDVQAIMNDPAKGIYVQRWSQNNTNLMLTIPGECWRGLNTNNGPVKCYTTCPNTFKVKCNFSKNSRCQIPHERLERECEVLTLTSSTQFCSLTITRIGDEMIYLANVFSGPPPHPEECVNTRSTTTSVPIYNCNCRSSYCNGAIRIESQPKTGVNGNAEE